MRRIISATIICALMLVPVEGAVADEEPVRRSGTIVTGVEWFYEYVLGEETQGCETAPDCQAWLETGCEPTVTGRNPAVMASIENVADLADGITPWRFEFQADWDCCTGWAVVQFWQQDCTEIPDSRWHSAKCSDNSCRTTDLRIPESAEWMTVTGFPAHPWIGELISGTGWATLEWTLTGESNLRRKR